MPEKLPTPQIIRTRRKTVALIITPEGKLLVRAPLRLSSQRIEEIIQGKADWIRSQQEKVLHQQALSKPHQFLEGEGFWFLGQQYPLRFVRKGRLPLVLSATHFELNQNYQVQASRVFETWYRQQARLWLTQRSDQIACQLGLKFNRLRLSSARTRWGSCSSRGTISLVWRLVMAPLPVIDYVVLHELIHLRTRNHSKAYWIQVADAMPDYRAQINWLKLHGHELNL